MIVSDLSTLTAFYFLRRRNARISLIDSNTVPLIYNQRTFMIVFVHFLTYFFNKHGHHPDRFCSILQVLFEQTKSEIEQTKSKIDRSFRSSLRGCWFFFLNTIKKEFLGRSYPRSPSAQCQLSAVARQ